MTNRRSSYAQLSSILVSFVIYLSMGLICSPDICQELKENIFRDIEDSDVLIDDIGAFSK